VVSVLDERPAAQANPANTKAIGVQSVERDFPSSQVFEQEKGAHLMQARILTGVLGTIFSAALVFATPVLAYDSHSSGGHVDHDYSYGGHVDHEYGNGWHRDHNYSGGGHVDHEYTRRPYYGYGYDHPAGTRGYRGKDARHHRRGHQHHHGR
jgi:hypothetical protein